MARLAPRSVFGSRRTETVEPTPAPEPEPLIVESGPRKKNAPTPTRRQAELARKERLHPTLTPKQQKALDRQARASQSQQARDAIDNTPQRQLARDFVDSRFHIGEVALPMLILLAFAVFLMPQTQFFVVLSMALSWSLIGLVVLDGIWTWFRFKKLAAQRLPGASLRGMGMYVFNRLIQFRALRFPKPRVKIGDQV